LRLLCFFLMPEFPKTCILVSTCDRYKVFAELTATLIAQHWDNHPPVYFSGADVDGMENWLPLQDDPKDWLSITKHALEELAALGFQQCYMILDDHPPVTTCHADHLNKTLPVMMDELDAVTICLNGAGYWRPGPEGKLLGKKKFGMEQMADSHQWKYQLHPALWNIKSFIELLDILLDGRPVECRTPWVFERELGSMGDQIANHLKRGSYRVNGRKMSSSRLSVLRDVVEKRTFDVIRSVMGKLFGIDMWKRIDSTWGWVYRYYEGPYPVIWSGMLRGGTVNNDFISWLKWHRKKEFLSQLTPILKQWLDEKK